MFKAMRFLLFFAFSFIVATHGSVAYAFQYGQCLLNRADSFNNELREYRNVAFAKAAIKKLALERNPELLKWNYGTTRFIYDLIVMDADLIRLNNIYKIIKAKAPENIKSIQEFFDGTSGHEALANVDEDKANENEKSVSDLVDLLENLTEGNADAANDIALLRKSLETSRVKDALGDMYDRIQEASVGATPVEPQTIEQWIYLATVFKAGLTSSDCKECSVEARSAFDKLILDWGKSVLFPEEDGFNAIVGSLPPLKKVKFPPLPAVAKAAQKVVNYYYLRSMEDFLFSRSGFTLSQVEDWVKADKNHKIILDQANRNADFSSEKNVVVKLFKYIQSKERVLGNAFDHFVWRGQEGTSLEKSIDGVARTLYGEAESCQISGASQFEAIGSIIAARSVSVDIENQEKNIFLSLANFGVGVFNVLSPIEIAPLISYKSGAADFGRTRELGANPVVSEMATPAQVVSRPGQFSVWKLGDAESYELTRWITFPASLGYPKNLKTVVSGPLGKDVDPAQRKVLCPNNAIFDKAVEVARELVTDYTAYANKYRFHQNGKRVVPYFYTHGANITLNFVKQIVPKPNFSMMDGTQANLSIYEGSAACRSLKLYQPKNFKVESSNSGKSKAKSAATKKKSIGKKGRK